MWRHRFIKARALPHPSRCPANPVAWQMDLSQSLQPWLSDPNKLDNSVIFSDSSQMRACPALIDEIPLTAVLNKKNCLDQCDRFRLNNARFHADDYARVTTANVPTLFMNRAALKLANIDSLCQPPLTWMDTQTNFTKASQQSQDGAAASHLCQTGEANHQFVFFDLCGAPGGFSEYIFWRREKNALDSMVKQRTLGYGVTLTKNNGPNAHNPPPPNFRLNRIRQKLSHKKHYSAYFKPLFGQNGSGDINDPQVRISLRHRAKLVKSKGSRVTLVTADGAIDVSGQENKQELIMQKLILAQASIALDLLSGGGDLVLKCFDISTTATASLILFIVCCFKKFAIIKPEMSRAANSERYLVCRGFKENDKISLLCAKHLNRVHYRWQTKSTLERSSAAVDLISPNSLKSLKNFTNYLRHTNNLILKKQYSALTKLLYYYDNPCRYLPEKNKRKRAGLMKLMMNLMKIPSLCHLSTLKKG